MSNIDSASILVGDELEAAGSSINTQATAIADELAKLVAQISPLADTWTGAAAQYFSVLQQEWNTAANGLFGPGGVLGEIANAMNVSWNNYCDAEFANVSTWQTN